MKKHPIEERAQTLGLNCNALALRASVDQGNLWRVFHSKLPLSFSAAEKLAPLVNSNPLTLVIASAAYRQTQGARLTGNEQSLIKIGTIQLGLDVNKLAALPVEGLVIGSIPVREYTPAPGIVMGSELDPNSETYYRKSLEFNKERREREANEEIPPAPAVILRKKEDK